MTTSFLLICLQLLEFLRPSSNLVHFLFDFIKGFLFQTLIQKDEIIIDLTINHLFIMLRNDHLSNLITLLDHSLIKKRCLSLVLTRCLLWSLIRYHIDRNRESLILHSDILFVLCLKCMRVILS